MMEKVDNPIYDYYSSVIGREIRWLWYPYIPYGKITLLQGDPGEGKSTLALNITALLTCGKRMPDGFGNDIVQSVVYQCSEDNLADTVKPRLLAAGADCGKVAYIVDEEGSLTIDDDRIEETIRKTQAGLFILDPLQSYVSQDSDMQYAGKMRALLGKLSLVAARTECAILLIGHMNKNSSGKCIYRGLGSIDIAAIARSVLMVTRNTDDPDIRYMLQIKSSLAPEGDPIGFRFDRKHGFMWLGKCRNPVVQEEITKQYAVVRKDNIRDELIALLSEGPVPSTRVLEQMTALDVSHRTLYTIKKDLHVESFKSRNAWFWKLPDRGGLQ